MTEATETPKRERLSLNAWIILGCSILLVVFLSGAMYVMLKYVNELTDSPLNYGAKKIASINQAQDLMCSCRLVGITNPNKNPEFFFNTTSTWNDRKLAPGSVDIKESSFDPTSIPFVINES